MLTEEIDDADDITPGALYDRYARALAGLVERRGVAAAMAETGLDRNTLRAVADGDASDLTLDGAAAILSLDDGRPDANRIRAEIEDRLLLGMTTAVLDVDTVAASVDLDLTPKEIQQKLEGRAPMTVEEYAHVYHLIGRRQW